MLGQTRADRAGRQEALRAARRDRHGREHPAHHRVDHEQEDRRGDRRARARRQDGPRRVHEDAGGLAAARAVAGGHGEPVGRADARRSSRRWTRRWAAPSATRSRSSSASRRSRGAGRRTSRTCRCCWRRGWCWLAGLAVEPRGRGRAGARGARRRAPASRSGARSSRTRAATRARWTTTPCCRRSRTRHMVRAAAERLPVACSTPSWWAARRWRSAPGAAGWTTWWIPAVGVVVLAQPGDRLGEGEPILELHYRASADLDAAIELLARRHRDRDEPPELPPLVVEEVSRGRTALADCAWSSTDSEPQPSQRPGPIEFIVVAGAVVGGASSRRWPRSSGAVPRGPAAGRPGGDPRDRLPLLQQPPRDRPVARSPGDSASRSLFALIVLKTDRRAARPSRCSATASPRCCDFAGVGSSFVFGPLGNKQAWPKIMTTVLGAGGGAVRRDLRVPGAADDHLHRGAVRHPLLLRRHAGGRPRCSPG